VDVIGVAGRGHGAEKRIQLRRLAGMPGMADDIACDRAAVF
jgi:hypothetical protein